MKIPGTCDVIKPHLKDTVDVIIAPIGESTANVNFKNGNLKQLTGE